MNETERKNIMRMGRVTHPNPSNVTPSILPLGKGKAPSYQVSLVSEILAGPGMRKTLTLPEAAEELGMDVRTLRVHIDGKEIPVMYVGERGMERIPRWVLVLWQVGKVSMIQDLARRAAGMMSEEFGVKSEK